MIHKITSTLWFGVLTLLSLLIASHAKASNPEAPQGQILNEYPHLKKYIYREVDSRFQFGFGLTPLRLMKNQAGVAVSIFQIHWSEGLLDWEIFNASFGTTISSDPTSTVHAFTFRTVPKFKITPSISLGPLFGVEFVSFPDVPAKINKNNFYSPAFEPYSSHGLIYGGVLSENFKLSDNYMMKLNQVVYIQTYSTKGTFGDWQYYYQNSSLNKDQTPISPGIVIALEFSLLF